MIYLGRAAIARLRLTPLWIKQGVFIPSKERRRARRSRVTAPPSAHPQASKLMAATPLARGLVDVHDALQLGTASHGR